MTQFTHIVHTHFNTGQSVFTQYGTVHIHFDIVHTHFGTIYTLFTRYDSSQTL